MKDLKKQDKYSLSDCCLNTYSIIGVAYVLVATVLTLITQSGFGILGMFLVGVILWHKSHGCCSCCDCYETKEGSCDASAHDIEKPKSEKTAVKKVPAKK